MAFRVKGVSHWENLKWSDLSGPRGGGRCNWKVRTIRMGGSVQRGHLDQTLKALGMQGWEAGTGVIISYGCRRPLWGSRGRARQERGEQGGILLSFVQAGKTKDLQESTERVTGPRLWQQACGLENLVRELSGQQPGFCDFVGRMR